MPTGHIFMAMSLDGFVARTDHALDWLMKQNTKGEDHGFDEFNAGIDGMVMGRGTYQTVLTFDEWPYSKPVVVMSQTLTDSDIPEHLAGKISLSTKDPRALMEELGLAGWSRIYVDGGKIVQSFLRDGLIADMQVTVIPILLGEGIRLFGALGKDIDLHLDDSTSFPSGLVSLKYKVAN